MSVYKELYHLLRDMDEDGIKLVHRISQRASEEEFAAFVRDGEMPMIELTADELRAVRGGNARPTRKTIREARRCYD